MNTWNLPEDIDDVSFVIDTFPRWGHLDFAKVKESFLQYLIDSLRLELQIPEGKTIYKTFVDDYDLVVQDVEDVKDIVGRATIDRLDIMEETCDGDTSSLVPISYLVYGEDTESGAPTRGY